MTEREARLADLLAQVMVDPHLALGDPAWRARASLVLAADG